MSAELRETEKEKSIDQDRVKNIDSSIYPKLATKRVNIEDLMFSLRNKQKKDKRKNIIISASLLSAIAVVGAIFSL
tara:strand:+ start:446 stop:673 length:228 start_codon:yes stop_codon:yes gene_type:complete